MATVNPDHRLEVRTGDELEALAGEINRLADRLRLAREGWPSASRPRPEPAETERARLTVILDAWPMAWWWPADGRITLANPRRPTAPERGRALLGAPISDFVGHDSLGPSLAERASTAAAETLGRQDGRRRGAPRRRRPSWTGERDWLRARPGDPTHEPSSDPRSRTARRAGAWASRTSARRRRARSGTARTCPAPCGPSSTISPSSTRWSARSGPPAASIASTS